LNAGTGKRIIPQLIVMGVTSDHQRAIAQGIAVNDAKAGVLDVQGVLPAPDGIIGQGVMVGLQKIDILEVIAVDAIADKGIPPAANAKVHPLVGVIVDEVAPERIVGGGDGDIDAVADVGVEIAVLEDLAVQDLIAVGVAQTDPVAETGDDDVLDRSSYRAPQVHPIEVSAICRPADAAAVAVERDPAGQGKPVAAARAEVGSHDVVAGNGVAALTGDRSAAVGGLKNSHGQGDEQEGKGKSAHGNLHRQQGACSSQRASERQVSTKGCYTIRLSAREEDFRGGSKKSGETKHPDGAAEPPVYYRQEWVWGP
jgi:hypothetical protein